MTAESKKTARLTAVARMYYDRNMTQNEIAREINVSRPMVSKLLAEARDSGIVTIIIDDTADECPRLAKNLVRSFGLKDVTVVPKGDGEEIEDRLAEAVFEMINSVSGQRTRLGIGWGKVLNRLCGLGGAPVTGGTEWVFPLTGGLESELPWEHCNGIAFALAEILGARAEPIYLPAVFQNEEEEKAAKLLPAYSRAMERWDCLNGAVLEITAAEKGSDCAGFILGHGFDIRGVFQSPGVKRFQADVSQLRQAKNIIAVASAEVGAAAVLGALGTELFSHLVLTSTVAEKILSI